MAPLFPPFRPLQYAIVLLFLGASTATVLDTEDDREYNIVLDKVLCPRPTCLPPLEAPPVDTDPIQLPPVHLPFVVPRARTLRHRCRCVKTVLRSQKVLQVVRVPVIRRYVQTITRPVKEVIVYRARPRNTEPIDCCTTF